MGAPSGVRGVHSRPKASHCRGVMSPCSTSPLRRAEHVRRSVEMLRETGADSVVSVVELPRHLSPDYV